jgi:hypothetical protein
MESHTFRGGRDKEEQQSVKAKIASTSTVHEPGFMSKLFFPLGILPFPSICEVRGFTFLIIV